MKRKQKDNVSSSSALNCAKKKTGLDWLRHLWEVRGATPSISSPKSCTPVHPIASYSTEPSWAWIKDLDMKRIVLHCRWPTINRKQFICLKCPTCSFCFNVLVLYQIKSAPLKRPFAKPGTGSSSGNKTEICWGRLILRQPSNITRAAQERGEIALGILPRR